MVSIDISLELTYVGKYYRFNLTALLILFTSLVSKLVKKEIWNCYKQAVL